MNIRKEKRSIIKIIAIASQKGGVGKSATCSSVLIPATPEYLSAKGLELVLKTIVKLKKRINLQVTFEGILLTMFEQS